MSILILQSRTEKKTTEWVLEPTNLPWERPELTLHLSSDLSQYSGAWQTLNQFPNQCQFTHSESLDSKGDQIPCIINANMHYKSFKQPSSIRLVSYTRVTALMIRKCPGLPKITWHWLWTDADILGLKILLWPSVKMKVYIEVKWTKWHALWMSFSPSPQLLQSLFKGFMSKVAILARTETVHELNNVDFPLPRLT